jgi:glycosyltransferase involved in cell wall biosynthesis
MSSPRRNGDLAGLRVLQLGPLYVEHVRRWAEQATAVGCEVHVAGHVRPGRSLTAFTHVAESVQIGPANPESLDTTAHEAWLRGVLFDLRPDLVQAHWLPTWGCLAARSGHPRVVVTPWGSDLYLSEGLLAARAHEALTASEYVVARSAHMRRAVIALGVPRERVVDVDLGVDLARFRPASAEERARLRSRLGLGQGPVVLSLRAGTELYNLDVVIEAYRRLRARLPDATLVLAPGDEPLAASVRAALDHDDAGIKLLARVPHAEMADYLRAATVGVSIPRSDGSPNSVWEALACGLPVVVSDLAQVRERVADCAAVRVIGVQRDGVAEALEDLARRRPALAESARGWAEANTDRRTEAARLGRLYAAAMTAPARPPARRSARPAGEARPSAGRRGRAAAAPRRPS